ncbi:MAG: phosphatidate cytidylyltransferase [Bifidobacteriaceae bacterium]|jgi:CDP-diglyceride synthetase|nr:phosphatidate cytidylyltransferase [Bifidobacteriaceae bacterium]
MEAPAHRSQAAVGRGRNLAVAVPTAFGLIVLLLASVLFSPWPFVALVVVALALALHELTGALARAGCHVPYVPLVVGAAFTQVAAARSGAPGVVVGVFLTLAAGVVWRVLEGDYRQLPDAAPALPASPPPEVSSPPPAPSESAPPLGGGLAGASGVSGTDGEAAGVVLDRTGSGLSPTAAPSPAPAAPAEASEPPARWRGRHAARPAEAAARSLGGDICATAFVTVYLPTLGALVVLLSFMPDGRWLVLLLVAVPVACDTGGYFAGSYLGRHKLAAQISPRKTWEGLAGSVLLAVAAAVGGMALMGRPWYFGLALGVLGALAATLGDLAESLLKRAIGIKDMGNLLPGHGGVLDRIDSILMTAPFFYAVITLFGAEVFG